MPECTNGSLELLVLELFNWPLKVSISISMFISLWVAGLKDVKMSKINNVFANSLLDAIIQDGGIRERSNKSYVSSLI